jgi:hypothetical protein
MARKFHHRRQHHHARKAAFRLPRGAGAIALGVLVVGFFVGYLVQVNATSSKGFQIRTLQNRISELKETGDKMELKVAQEQSVASVEQKVQAMGMVPAQQVQYVAAPSDGVAMR